MTISLIGKWVSNFAKTKYNVKLSTFSLILPPYWLLLGSPMIMDPQVSQQQADLHDAVVDHNRK